MAKNDTRAGAKPRRTNVRGTADGIGQVRIRITLHGHASAPVVGNISRSVIVEGGKVSEVHARVRAALEGIARDPHHVERFFAEPFGSEKND